MGQIFISHVKEDFDLAAELAGGLESAGFTAWYYERDAVAGQSYLVTIGQAIADAEALLLLVTPNSLAAGRTHQVTKEVEAAHDAGKPFLPVLAGVSHEEMQRRQPLWRQALGTATSLSVPPEGASRILPALVRGFKALGVGADAEAPDADDTPEGWSPVGSLLVRFSSRFEEARYEPGTPYARFLLEVEAKRNPRSPGSPVNADIFLVLDGSTSMRKPDRYPLLRKAVGELIRRMDPRDRLGIGIFSDGAHVVLHPSRVSAAQKDPKRVLAAMDASPQLFRRGTKPAAGLRQALEALEGLGERRNPVRRVYLLTDGVIGDTTETEQVLADFRPRRIETHVYGFGTRFDAGALKALVAGQLGGSVKPICNNQDVVAVFGHLAEVNRRLVAADASFTVEFAPDVRCGDAWSYRPHERHLGLVANNRLRHPLGALEAGRTYSTFFEVRLPESSGEATRVATALLAWNEAGKVLSHGADISTDRTDGLVIDLDGAEGDPKTRRTFAILDGLRRPLDDAAQLAALRARREVAVEEGHTDLIEALDKQIEALDRDEEISLGETHQLLIKSDKDSGIFRKPSALESCENWQEYDGSDEDLTLHDPDDDSQFNLSLTDD